MVASLLQGMVALAGLVLAGSLLVGWRGWIDAPGVGRGVRWLWGIATGLASLGLLAAVWVPFFTFFAASLLLLLGLMGAVMMWMRGAPGRRVGGLGLFALICAGIGAMQPLGLKVLALPKADELPRQMVPSARVLKTYGPGMWFEGIAAAPDGTLYLAQNTGENYATGDKSQVHASVIQRSPDGSERVFFTLPQGSTAGVMAIAADGTIYMAGTGAHRGLWRISPDGTGKFFVQLPRGAWPNGVTLGPDGKLYVADSALGVLWRVDPTTGTLEKAYAGKVLRARPYIALPPGANGVHFHGRDLYVTVSDQGTLLKLHLGEDGKLGAPTVAARGVPADDFAVDGDGTVYLTTHIYNTIVRVTPDGQRMVVADAHDGIVGATDAVFGRSDHDRRTLYVVTDGGALATGNRAARGTLVALDVPAR